MRIWHKKGRRTESVLIAVNYFSTPIFCNAANSINWKCLQIFMHYSRLLEKLLIRLFLKVSNPWNHLLLNRVNNLKIMFPQHKNCIEFYHSLFDYNKSVILPNLSTFLETWISVGSTAATPTWWVWVCGPVLLQSGPRFCTYHCETQEEWLHSDYQCESVYSLGSEGCIDGQRSGWRSPPPLRHRRQVKQAKQSSEDKYSNYIIYLTRVGTEC